MLGWLLCPLLRTGDIVKLAAKSFSSQDRRHRPGPLLVHWADLIILPVT